MAIEQGDTIVHFFILRQFLHNTASPRVIQDGRSKKFYFGDLGLLDFWEQFVEIVDYAGKFFRCGDNIDYLGLLRVNFEAYPPMPCDAPLHIAEDRFRGKNEKKMKMCEF